ncbi:MAG: organic hydroperoxide reductase OsmC/OhrA [Oceanospirillaceae bacterium]|jgi:organic hydroperoxide reductase OsmC/OhrA
MSEYSAQVIWQRQESEKFIDNKYSRGHRWQFDGGMCIDASSSPHIVPLPYSVEQNVDPEEAFIASISSCHMLFFLNEAAKRKLTINKYEDNAVGTMQQNDQGKMSITEVVLNVHVEFIQTDRVSIEQMQKMHHASHEQCFIANSINGQVTTNIV